MNKQLPKNEIWRNQVSPMARFLFGVRVFLYYVGFVLSCFNVLVQVGLIHTGLNGYLENAIKRNAFSSNNSTVSLGDLSSMIAVSQSVIVLIYLFSLIVSFLMILWYHIGKSRVITTLNFICNLILFLLVLFLLVFSYLDLMVVAISLLIILVFLVGDFIIMRGTYQYHRALANVKFNEQDRITRAVEKGRSNQQFQITKPTLEHVYYPMKETKKSEAEAIKMDEYLNNKSMQGSSIYQNTLLDQNTSDRKQQKDEKKDQKDAVKFVHEQETVLSDDPSAGTKYDMEKRPLLSAINEEIKKQEIEKPSEEKTKEEIETVSIEDDPLQDTTEVIEQATIQSNTEIRVDTIQESSLQEEVQKEVQEDLLVKEESDTTDFEPNRNEDVGADTNSEASYEKIENGMKVDTSLGYRRITFEDL